MGTLKGKKKGERVPHIFLGRNSTKQLHDGKKEGQFFIPKFHGDHNKVD